MSPVVALVMMSMLSGARPFGYFIGDEIVLQTDVALQPGFVLEEASLPHPGPVTYWLDLTSVQRRQIEPGRHRLLLHYQTFYAPLGVQTLEVPGFMLVATRAERRVEMPVGSWRFSMSPLRDVGPRTGGDTVALRRDIAPTRISIAPYLAGGVICVGVALASVFALAFHRAWGPFRRRAGRPFARAAHALRRQPDDIDGYLAGLLSLHRAFDIATGRRVLAEDVNDVLRVSPGFAAASDDIQRFFQTSRRAFFGEDPQGAMESFSPAALAALGARLAAAERESS